MAVLNLHAAVLSLRAAIQITREKMRIISVLGHYHQRLDGAGPQHLRLLRTRELGVL
jgi:hypothetical protein